LKGPAGLMQEREDSLTKNQGQSQEFGTRTPTNNDSNLPLFSLPHFSWVLSMASTGPRASANQLCTHGGR